MWTNSQLAEFVTVGTVFSSFTEKSSYWNKSNRWVVLSVEQEVAAQNARCMILVYVTSVLSDHEFAHFLRKCLLNEISNFFKNSV